MHTAAELGPYHGRVLSLTDSLICLSQNPRKLFRREELHQTPLSNRQPNPSSTREKACPLQPVRWLQKAAASRLSSSDFRLPESCRA
jgi:allophanate hydrolase subunit 2